MSPSVYIADPGAVGYQAVRDTDLTTKRGQQTFLMDSLGLTRVQAAELIRAYVLDERDREARQVSAQTFGQWLRSNYWAAVGHRSRPRLAPEWRVAT
jgi:hypothetical protein